MNLARSPEVIDSFLAGSTKHLLLITTNSINKLINSWKIKKFKDLKASEVYKIMQLRNEVFVVEQNCVYQDADGKDAKSFHLLGLNQKDDVLAYCRIVPAGIAYEDVSIGRVVTSPKVRGKGFGKELMVQALDKIRLLYSNVEVRIGAQVYLKEFYSEMGFVAVGKEYMEDNIPHIEMVKKVMLNNH